MKRWICRIGFVLCLLVAPFICGHTVYAGTIANSVASEAGFHRQTVTVGTVVQLSASDLMTSLTWRSSAPSVVKVDTAGQITALSEGTAVVYATSAKDISVFDSWIITVTPSNEDVGSLTINYRTAGLTTGQSIALVATPEGNAAGSITWSTTDETVAAVSSDGRVTAKAQGCAVIYAVSENGKYTASCMVYVINPSISLPVGTSTLPEEKTLYNTTSKLGSGKIIWTTSDSSVAVVRRGFIEAVGIGKATITAITESGTGAQCTVTVTAAVPVTSAYLNPNNPVAGVENTLVMVGSPNYTSVKADIFDANRNIIQTVTVDSGYTDETESGRTVRIWTIPLTIDSSGTYTVKCTSGTAAYSFEFRTLVSESTQVNTPESSSPSSDVSSTVSSSSDVSSDMGSSDSTSSTDTGTSSGTSSENTSAGSSSSDSTSSESSSGNSSVGMVRSWYTSNDLLTFLTQYEGLCQTIIYDVVNVPTIGYGRALFNGDTFYNYQTHAEAWGNMCKLVNETFVPELNIFVNGKGLMLNQAQFDALTSYSYNMGAYCWRYYGFKLRTLLIENPDVTQIDPTELKYAFGKQSWTGGYFYTGLYRRRMDEWEMFLTGDYRVHPSNNMTGDFAVPNAEDRKDPEKYGSDWHWRAEGEP